MIADEHRPPVVVPYYLSQGYNLDDLFMHNINVVVPYYLSQGYNGKIVLNELWKL